MSYYLQLAFVVFILYIIYITILSYWRTNADKRNVRNHPTIFVSFISSKKLILPSKEISRGFKLARITLPFHLRTVLRFDYVWCTLLTDTLYNDPYCSDFFLLIYEIPFVWLSSTWNALEIFIKPTTTSYNLERK